VHWLNPTGERKVHSLVDKVYKMKNLELAWEKVKRNRGAGGIDGQSLAEFEGDLKGNLERLHGELRFQTYQPQPVKRQFIPKSGQPGKFRPLGIPIIYDRVCQQALMNRLEAIFEPIFADASFGYRRGRSTKDAMRKIWRELEQENEWVVDADLKDFFGSADHDKLMEMLNQRVADGRVLGLLESIMKVGYSEDKQIHPSERGVPQGGVISPLMSNILL
jgi:RNA-directed DNA polymerase